MCTQSVCVFRGRFMVRLSNVIIILTDLKTLLKPNPVKAASAQLL